MATKQWILRLFKKKFTDCCEPSEKVSAPQIINFKIRRKNKEVIHKKIIFLREIE